MGFKVESEDCSTFNFVSVVVMDWSFIVDIGSFPSVYETTEAVETEKAIFAYQIDGSVVSGGCSGGYLVAVIVEEEPSVEREWSWVKIEVQNCISDFNSDLWGCWWWVPD